MRKSYPIKSPLLNRGLGEAMEIVRDIMDKYGMSESMTDKEWSNILIGAIKQAQINVLEI